MATDMQKKVLAISLTITDEDAIDILGIIATNMTAWRQSLKRSDRARLDYAMFNYGTRALSIIGATSYRDPELDLLRAEIDRSPYKDDPIIKKTSFRDFIVQAYQHRADLRKIVDDHMLRKYNLT